MSTAPPPPPPPAGDPERVHLHTRIRADRDAALRAYQAKHNTTMQKVIDQALDEYLDRRGLLPEN